MPTDGYCEDLIVGGTAHVTGDFYNSTGVLTDPSDVDFYWFDPEAGSTVITGHYDDADAELVRASTGRYYVDLPTTVAGRWTYRWEGSGTLNTATEGTFTVKPSAFTGRST